MKMVFLLYPLERRNQRIVTKQVNNEKIYLFIQHLNPFKPELKRAHAFACEGKLLRSFAMGSTFE
jgi:hypothetical protein